MKNWAEADTAQIYQQPYFEAIRQASPAAVTESIRELAQNGTIGSLLSLFTRRVSSEELSGTIIDPTGPAAPIFRPRELAKLLEALLNDAEIATFWVGQNAYLTARGRFNAPTAVTLGDLDFTFMSLGNKPIRSAGYLHNQLHKVGLAFRDAHDFGGKHGFAVNPVVGEFRYSEESKDSRIRLAFLRSKNYPTYHIDAAKIYYKEGNNRPSFGDIYQRSIADVGYCSEEPGEDFLKLLALSLPREDSVALLLVPKPEEKFPFDVWLIDPQHATDETMHTTTLSYPPKSRLLFPDLQKGCRGVLKAQDAIVRGYRLSCRRGKPIPEGLFLEASRAVHETAPKRLPLNNQEKIKTSLKLEHLNEKLNTIIQEYPRLFGEFLASTIAANIFPRVGETLVLEAVPGESVRQYIRHRHHPFNNPKISLSDVISFFTVQAGRSGLPIWLENRRRYRDSFAQSPWARNMFSPFPVINDSLWDEPWGADIASVSIHRIVDLSLTEALKALNIADEQE